MNMEQMYDLIVVGGGPAGYAGAIKAAQLGKKVAVVEAVSVGGTCLNRGCVPTKSLMHAAEFFVSLNDGEKLGVAIDVSRVSYDYKRMVENKNETVAKLRRGIETLFKQNDIDFYSSYAKIISSGSVVAGDQVLTARKILVATGCAPAIPPIDGAGNEGVVTSDDALDFERVPNDIIIIGGGVIGVEFASLYNMLGSSVTVIEAESRILPLIDAELSRSTAMLLKKRGVTIETSALVKKIEWIDNRLSCSYVVNGGEKQAAADTVLIATGRRPNTEGLFDDSVKIALDKGYIVADTSGATSVDGIYAAGDVVKGAMQLAHVASAMGENAVCAMFGQEPHYSMNAIPSCIYISPEIASVGYTEKQARDEGIECVTGKCVMGGNARTAIASSERGFIKLVFESESRTLIGAQLMCERATDIIDELTLAVEKKLICDDLCRTVRAHPTFAEAITEAAKAALH